MSFDDSSDISFPASASRLLSESPILPSQTGSRGDDLSISELSLSDHPPLSTTPFSLLAPRDSGSLTPDLSPHEFENNPDGTEQAEKGIQNIAKAREEKLQSDVFILRKLNASFALFNEALQDTQSANQRIAIQLEQTDALLNKYINMLSRSEEFARLVFDEQWHGADQDEEILEQERIVERERARREAEERNLVAQQEEERRLREERERVGREQRERVEQEKKGKTLSRGGFRGVRGTRTSTRTTGGVPRVVSAGVTTSQRYSVNTTTNRTDHSGTSLKPPAVSSGVRSASTGSSVQRLPRGTLS